MFTFVIIVLVAVFIGCLISPPDSKNSPPRRRRRSAASRRYNLKYLIRRHRGEIH